MKAEDMKALAIFGLGVLAMIAAIVIWQRSVQRWVESDHLESNAYEVVHRINQLENHLAMAENERRDYAVSALGKDVRTLRQLANEDVGQRTRWEALETLLSRRLNQLLGSAQPDNETPQQLRALLRNIGAEEDLRLHRRIERKQAQMFTTVQEITAILIVGMVLFLGVFWLLHREILARRDAEVRIREEHAALEKAMHDLDQSHWHLDKVAEFLPICMECGKVKTAGAQWEPLIEYFRKNELFLTHGLCPECDAKVRASVPRKKPDPGTATSV
jgi:flagellar biosynthesis regulator FlaF